MSSGLTLLSQIAPYLPLDYIWNLLPLVCLRWCALSPGVVSEMAGRAGGVHSTDWLQLHLARGWLLPGVLPEDLKQAYYKRQTQLRASV